MEGKRRLSGGTKRPCVVCVSIAGALLGATEWALIFLLRDELHDDMDNAERINAGN